MPSLADFSSFNVHRNHLGILQILMQRSGVESKLPEDADVASSRDHSLRPIGI